MFCTNCGWRPPKAKGLCGACHQQQRRTGQPRSAELVQRDLTRKGY